MVIKQMNDIGKSVKKNSALVFMKREGIRKKRCMLLYFMQRGLFIAVCKKKGGFIRIYMRGT